MIEFLFITQQKINTSCMGKTYKQMYDSQQIIEQEEKQKINTSCMGKTYIASGTVRVSSVISRNFIIILK